MITELMVCVHLLSDICFFALDNIKNFYSSSQSNNCHGFASRIELFEAISDIELQPVKSESFYVCKFSVYQLYVIDQKDRYIYIFIPDIQNKVY